MTISEIIRERRTIREFNDKKLSLDLVTELLETSVWAPYHGIPEPWRFVVFSDNGMERLIDMILQALSPPERKEYGDKLEAYLRTVPVAVVVVGKLDRNQKIMDEVSSSVSALIQNFQLAAWEKEIGVVWKTQTYMYAPSISKSLELKADEKIAGVLLCGYFDKKPSERPRESAKSRTIFINE
ncbi:nitroreductase family protein [Lacrimispora sp.]|jgi:nitroreductase|uniref:nitroreductase family protein n=1 Tax=Lacrimispora sp. TaxID=2719234 RepID=UPI0028B05829|nr:nitroreductase family protein [Lacrimispora sp.]